MSEYVLLGVPDIKIDCKHASWSTNKIGGKADWMKQDIGSPQCKQCDQLLILVMQIYCPLDNSQYHRTIYVFCCLNKSCWTLSKNWYVLRMQSRQEQNTKILSKTKPKKMFDSWGEDDNDWGTDDLSECDFGKASFQSCDSRVDVFTTNLKRLRLNDDAASLVFTKTEPNQLFPSFYINVFDESNCELANNDSEHIKNLIDDYNKREEAESSSSCGFNVSKREVYEKEDVKDKLFYKFWKKLKLCSSQVIRYSWKGSPVLFTSAPNSVPKCSLCGADRKFEFQLMPALISFLQINKKDDERIEFGTILFYTCSNSCWNDDDDTPLQEHSFYFPDPDLNYFKSQFR